MTKDYQQVALEGALELIKWEKEWKIFLSKCDRIVKATLADKIIREELAKHKCPVCNSQF